jgi:hypothetical protein
MVSGADFIELARAAGQGLAAELGMDEIRTEDAGRYAAVEWANSRRAFTLYMDAVQDYSVQAVIERTDVPRPSKPPTEPADFIGYDLTALLARNDRPYAGLGACQGCLTIT